MMSLNPNNKIHIFEPYIPSMKIYIIDLVVIKDYGYFNNYFITDQKTLDWWNDVKPSFTIQSRTSIGGKYYKHWLATGNLKITRECTEFNEEEVEIIKLIYG